MEKRWEKKGACLCCAAYCTSPGASNDGSLLTGRRIEEEEMDGR